MKSHNAEEEILQLSSLLYVLKLGNGDELLCVLVDVREDGKGIVIESPVLIRTIPVMTEDGIVNQIASQLWMSFSEDRTFFIPSKDIITFGRMATKNHEHYLKLLNDLTRKNTRITANEKLESFVVEGNDTIQ